MGILDRVSTILRANINALLDQAEDPELVLTQILSDMKDAIAQARTQVAEMIAQEKLFQGDMEKNQAQAPEWARKAELALGRGSEELAKEALRRKVDYDRNASSYMQQLIAQQQVVTKLKSDLNALQSKYDSAMRNRESMIARHKAAMAQQKIAATAQQLSAIDPSSARACRRVAFPEVNASLAAARARGADDCHALTNRHACSVAIAFHQRRALPNRRIQTEAVARQCWPGGAICPYMELQGHKLTVL